MPYDENGNFIYPLPARKGRPVKKPLVRPAVPPPPLVFPTPARSEPATPSPVNVPPVAVKVEPEPLVLPVPENSAVFTIQEGNNRWQMSELDLAHIWNAQHWPTGLQLTTTDGEPVEVVYRGRWSGGFGPDFKGAIIKIGQTLHKGAVELHLRSGDWQLHGHHQDSRYNEVVLQVVLEDNSPAVGPSRTEAGQVLPVLALLPLFQKQGARLAETLAQAKASGTRLGSLSESDGPCCDRVAEHQTDLLAVVEQIDELGNRRFEERVSRFEAACAADSDSEPQQAAQELWAGLLEALGYSQNKAPFRKLAAALPLAAVVELDREARHRKESAEERLLNLEAVLLGMAGLLPSQRRLKAGPRRVAESSAAFELDFEDGPDNEDFVAARYSEELERRWAWLTHQLRASLPHWQPLQQSDWTFARLRPPNHPSRRIAGLARLVLAWQLSEPGDLIELLAAELDQPPAEAVKSLNARLRVGLAETDSDSDAFWLRRFDFSDRAIMADQLAKGAGVDLIGTDRAADMVVNIVLPFLVAFGRDRHRRDLTLRALAAYHAHPKLSSNELVENVAKQVFRYWLENPAAAQPYLEATGQAKGRSPTLTIARLINGARRQQGLIYLHHQFCAEQNFGACPLA